VHYNNYASGADVLAFDPDVVIVASGGLPNFGDLGGEELCLSTWDILSGDVKPGQRVLVYDGTGRHEALSCAEFLADKAATVTLAIIDDRVGAEMGYAERASHRKQVYLKRIKVETDLVLKSVQRRGDGLLATLVNDLTDEPVEIEADQVVVERGTFPVDEVFLELKDDAANRGITDIEQPVQAGDAGAYLLYRIGDAVSSRSVHAALLDAYRIAIVL
jgi:thioredoxin reductase